MFTLVGWSEVRGPETAVAITALVDQSVNVSGTQVTIPAQLSQLIGVYGIGANITDLQMVTPSLRTPYLPNIRPLERAATPAVPALFYDRSLAPLILTPGDYLQAVQSNDHATTGRVAAFAWLSDGAPQPVSGNILPLKLTGTTTLVANTWTAVTLTASQTLPRGTYTIVGMNAQSTGGIVARLILPGYPWRPGVICHTGVVTDPLQPFRNGALGVFGQFAWNLLPQVEFLSSSADAAETVILDLVKTG